MVSEQPLVEVSDVETAMLTTLSPAQAGPVTGLCAQASAMLRMRRPDIDDRIARWEDGDTTGIPAVVVAAVLADVIKRVVVNPSGLWSRSETDGDYSVSETYPGARAGSDPGAPGDLTLTPADLAKIDAVSGWRPRRITTSCLPYPSVARAVRP